MDGKVIIGTELDTKSFDEQIKQTEDKLNKLERAYEKASKVTGKLKPNEQAMANLRKEIEKTRNTLIDLKAKQEKLDTDYTSIGFSLKDIVSKVTRWGLAIFGVRSAYMGIRQAMSILSSENEQIATDIEYMRWILAQTLKPVVEWIIKGLYMVLTLVNMITKALFRYDFLSGKGAENFKQAKTNSAGITKNLREANKQLAGFDEMNVLNDTSSGGTGGSVGLLGGDWKAPDFSGFEQTILNLKNRWYDFGEEMRKSLYDMPFDVWTKAFGKWDLAVFGVTQTVHGLWGMITTLGEFFVDLWEFIKALIQGDTEKAKEKFKELIDDIIKYIKYMGEVITGIGNIIKGVIKGILMTVWGWLFEDINKAINKFNEFRDKVVNVFTDLRNKIRNKITEIQNFLTEKFGIFGTAIGTVIGGSFKAAINLALAAIEKILNTPINAINGLIAQINKLGINMSPMKTFKFPRLAKGGIINMPGKGIPVGSAIGGERGQEGVIPLTDSQQMALLGEAIGRYITINANITNMMNGRIISRELEKIQNDDNFAFNK